MDNTDSSSSEDSDYESSSDSSSDSSSEIDREESNRQMGEELEDDDLVNTFDSLFCLDRLNPIENSVEHIGGSFEVLFFDSDGVLTGYTGWIPLDTAERIATKMNGGRNIVQIAHILRNYDVPLPMKCETFENSHKPHYKHKVNICPIHENFNFYSVDHEALSDC